MISCKTFFFSVFELPSPKNTQKGDKTTKNRGKTDIEVFVDFFEEKVFDMDFLQNIFYDVFELPSPYRETPKNVLKKGQGKKKLAGR
jgi:hypothetical protein